MFLFAKASKALRIAGFSFITTQTWNTDTHHFGIAAVMAGTVLIALVAMVVSIPLALGLSLFICEIAKGWIQRFLVSTVDLMAAVPSVVYGLWGFEILQGHVIGVSRWISTWLGWIPIFEVKGGSLTEYSASTFIAGIVVSMMAAPIMCAVMREAFSQAPAGEREGAYALGATRWGMIRSVVLPFGKGGIIGGVMLGLGRALGET
ncbi:MAG: ABC transporter permease subunit, partial [Acidimicrobiales bacterium]|nr:ABC transporter permease subunit [Acidimicrobiales bacterium]